MIKVKNQTNVKCLDALFLPLEEALGSGTSINREITFVLEKIPPINQKSFFSDVLPQNVVESIIQQGFPALAKTTKPIPASVFSYRFASASNNQTPYYISSDIVLR